MDLTELQANPYVWAILSLCTIFSVALAIWALIKGKKKLELSCYTTTKSIMKDGKELIEGLKVVYNERVISDLSITRLAIWNSGTEVLNVSDIVATQPLQITTANEEILDAIIITSSEKTNECKIVHKSERNVCIGFEYMNKRDGLVIQILHTGDAAGLKVICKIKGGEKLKCVNRDSQKKVIKKLKRNKKIVLILGITICALETLLALFVCLGLWGGIPLDSPSLFDMLLLYEQNDIQKAAFDGILISTIVIVLCPIYCIIMFWKGLKSKFHTNIPGALRDDLDLLDK